MDNKDALKDLSTMITVGIIFSYVLGYLIVTGFLVNYEVVNDDLLNLNFLKAGFVFLIILMPVLVIFNTYVRYDGQDFRKNLLPNLKALIKSIIISMLYSIMLSLLFINFTKLNYNLLLYLYGITIATCFYSFIVLILLSSGADKFNWCHFTANVIWLCVVSFFFGTHIYEDLPKSFTGGFPNSTQILCKEESKDYLKNIGFNFDTTFADNVLIRYSSNDKYLISKGDKCYYLSKNLFNGFRTIKNK